MRSDLQFKSDSATSDDILRHLLACDNSFTPSLSSRVNIPSYALKLRENATTFETWSNDAMIGLLAVYLDTNRRSAFISNLSVELSYRRCGIASRLLNDSLAFLSSRRVLVVSLEVHENSTAQRLYSDAGFLVASDTISHKRDIARMEYTFHE